MVNQVNKRHRNLWKENRAKRASRKKALNREITSIPETGLAVNPTQKRALRSNPNAALHLSRKRLKKIAVKQKVDKAKSNNVEYCKVVGER
jgi:hypothetical protein